LKQFLNEQLRMGKYLHDEIKKNEKDYKSTTDLLEKVITHTK